MANTIKIKRSAVPSKTPQTSDLQLGELAVNTYDGRLFIKKDNGAESIVELGAIGPAGSAATVSVGAVSTGAAGSSVSVTNSGTSSAAILNFTIPRGDTGATGATGSAGQGVPSGGSSGQILAKTSNANYDTHWIDAPAGGGGSSEPTLSAFLLMGA